MSFLHRAFLGAAALAAAVAAVSGCDSDLDYTGMEPLACANDAPDWLVDVKPAEPATYVELRGYDLDGEHYAIASTGTPCAEATDPPACTEALEAPTLQTGFQLEACEVCDDMALVVNRGDAVETLIDRDAVVAFFGEIDTPLEAAWVVELRRGKVPCSPGVRATSDGWEVAATQDCGDELIFSVDRDGSSRVVDENSGGGCSEPEEDSSD